MTLPMHRKNVQLKIFMKMAQTSHRRKISTNHQTKISKLHNSSKLNSNPFTILSHVPNFNREMKIQHSIKLLVTSIHVNHDTKSSAINSASQINLIINVQIGLNYCCEDVSITYN